MPKLLTLLTPITYDMINVGFLLKEAEEFKSIFYIALAYMIQFKSIMFHD